MTAITRPRASYRQFKRHMSGVWFPNCHQLESRRHSFQSFDADTTPPRSHLTRTRTLARPITLRAGTSSRHIAAHVLLLPRWWQQRSISKKKSFLFYVSPSPSRATANDRATSMTIAADIKVAAAQFMRTARRHSIYEIRHHPPKSR